MLEAMAGSLASRPASKAASDAWHGASVANTWVSSPNDDDAVAVVVGLELADVGDQLVGEVLLVLALLDVRSVEAFRVLAVEHGRHRLDSGEFILHLLEQLVFEHARVLGSLVAVVFEDVPAAERDLVQCGERDEVLDERRAAVGALAKAVGAHFGGREPMGFASPFRMAKTPAMVVVLTAPSPTSRTPSLPLAGAI